MSDIQEFDLKKWIDKCKQHCANAILNTSVGKWLEGALLRIEMLHAENNVLKPELKELKAEVERLRCENGKLLAVIPQTADGKPFIPGETYYKRKTAAKIIAGCWSAACQLAADRMYYSTEKAAKDASPES